MFDNSLFQLIIFFYGVLLIEYAIILMLQSNTANTIATTNTLAGRKELLDFRGDAFRVVTPQAVQRATLKEDRCTYPGAVVDRITLYVEDEGLFHFTKTKTSKAFHAKTPCRKAHKKTNKQLLKTGPKQPNTYEPLSH